MANKLLEIYKNWRITKTPNSNFAYKAVGRGTILGNDIENIKDHIDDQDPTEADLNRYPENSIQWIKRKIAILEHEKIRQFNIASVAQRKEAEIYNQIMALYGKLSGEN